MIYDSADIDVCETCYMVYHYGIDHVEYEIDSTTDYAPLERVPAGYDIADISYHPKLERFTVFSKSPCEGCGSLLAGSRHPLVISTEYNLGYEWGVS